MTSLVFDGSVLPTILDYEQLFGGVTFERPKEGINTIGGFCTLQGHAVFVKFLGKPIALRAALVDSIKPLFGLPSNGCCVARIRMPDSGVSLPWAKRPGAQMVRKGLEWVLITRRLSGVSVTRYLVAASGLNESMVALNTKTPIYRLMQLPRDQHVIRLLTSVLAFRLVVGVGDMGLGNFIYDDAGTGHIFSIDEGSAFTEENKPDAGEGGAQRTFLKYNLLCEEFKLLAVQDGRHLEGASFFDALNVDTVCAQISAHIATHYSAHYKKLAPLVNAYVRPNFLTVKESLHTLLTSVGGGKRGATATAASSSSQPTSKRPAALAGGMDEPADKRRPVTSDWRDA